MKKIATLLIFLLCFCCLATMNVYDFQNEQQEQQFKHLIKELRCPKCQNNNLADSNAPLATDIKNYVYQSVKKGSSDEKITNFLISRYGQFITYRPNNQWLWILPILVAGLSLLIIILVINRNKKTSNCNKNIVSMDTIIEQYKREK